MGILSFRTNAAYRAPRIDYFSPEEGYDYKYKNLVPSPFLPGLGMQGHSISPCPIAILAEENFLEHSPGAQGLQPKLWHGLELGVKVSLWNG